MLLGVMNIMSRMLESALASGGFSAVGESCLEGGPRRGLCRGLLGVMSMMRMMQLTALAVDVVGFKKAIRILLLTPNVEFSLRHLRG